MSRTRMQTKAAPRACRKPDIVELEILREIADCPLEKIPKVRTEDISWPVTTNMLEVSSLFARKSTVLKMKFRLKFHTENENAPR